MPSEQPTTPNRFYRLVSTILTEKKIAHVPVVAPDGRVSIEIKLDPGIQGSDPIAERNFDVLRDIALKMPNKDRKTYHRVLSLFLKRGGLEGLSVSSGEMVSHKNREPRPSKLIIEPAEPLFVPRRH